MICLYFEYSYLENFQYSNDLSIKIFPKKAIEEFNLAILQYFKLTMTCQVIYVCASKELSQGLFSVYKTHRKLNHYDKITAKR